LYRIALPILKSAARATVPVAKKAGKAMARQAVDTGMEIARDLAAGDEWRMATKKRVAEGVDKLAAKTGESIRNMTGGQQRIAPALAARMLHSHRSDTVRAGASRKRKSNPIKRSVPPRKKKKLSKHSRVPELNLII
jgi:hypothetical protein